MNNEETAAESSTADGATRKVAFDATAIELATGLSIRDMEALGSDASPEIRARLAAKFAHEFDRLAKDKVSRLAADLLDLFSKDRELSVRASFAKSIGGSPYLPLEIAKRLARDDIDVAEHLLRDSPVLDEAFIADVIETMDEAYALAVADRSPLGPPLIDVLMEHKGTRRVAARILDNKDAELSEAVLLRLHEWGQSDPDIAARLQRRPNLPFAFVNQSVAEIADRVQWSTLGKRTMSQFEATKLQTRFSGKGGQPRSTKGARFDKLYRSLKKAFVKGDLKPSTLLTFLRDHDIDRLECGFAIMANLEIRWVRKLLYGSDRRGLAALCLKAAFNTADYLAFRMALSLAELGSLRENPQQRYSEKSMKYARDQFEDMRSKPDQLKRWLPTEAI